MSPVDSVTCPIRKVGVMSGKGLGFFSIFRFPRWEKENSNILEDWLQGRERVRANAVLMLPVLSLSQSNANTMQMFCVLIKARMSSKAFSMEFNRSSECALDNTPAYNLSFFSEEMLLMSQWKLSLVTHDFQSFIVYKHARLFAFSTSLERTTQSSMTSLPG